MSATIINVKRDEAGLRQAALELMEESLDAPERERLERVAAMAANGEAMLRDVPQRRTLSPGYYTWIKYVVDEIVGPMESGVVFHESSLLTEEMLGLKALRFARADFRRLHPPCRGCGMPLPSAELRKCADCEAAR